MINNEVREDFNTGVYLNQILNQVEETLRMCMGSIETSIRDAANGVQTHAGGYRWKYKDDV